MNEHEHCFNTLGTRFAMIEIQLALGNRERASEIHKEAVEWFKATYQIIRIPDSSRKKD